jgi:hypothetical protein
MRVLLVANNPEAQPPADGYDLYVHFNTPIHWGETPLDKSIVAVRKNPTVVRRRSFQCRKNLEGKVFKLNVPLSKIVAVGWVDECRAIDPHIEIIPCDGVKYPAGQSPTSGYAAIHYYVNRGDKVYLCGFDLEKARYYHTTKMHNPDYEIHNIDKMVSAGLIHRHVEGV